MNTFFERIHSLDTKAFLWINLKQGCTYYRLVRNISRSGDGILYFVAAVSILLIDQQNGTSFFATAALAYSIDVLLYLLLKNKIKRNRPQQKLQDFTALIEPSDKFSFPSGHTAAAFVFATLIFQFYPPYAAAFFIWASLIGISRVLLGVHYPGDILAGILLGTLSAISSVKLIQQAFLM
ncbi:phosphatase PAP2 family protein [Pleionea sediminis]|uniref:phosphatase PAP2 family protein n=1 Tax=Pleionea sediminis TaxID=2569479 RepID=UPI00118508B6|nr:phosphatase PAP2 family protein [Pleionea sediminis]